MHRHGGVQTSGQDVYVNVVGGLKLPKLAQILLFYWLVPPVYEVKPLPQQLAVLVRLDCLVKFVLYRMVKND